MRGQQDRHALLLQRTNQLEEIARRLRVEAAGRLVEDRHRRALHQDFGDRQALAHAARIGAHGLAAGLFEAHPLQRRRDALVGLGGLQPAEGRGVAQIGDPAEVVVEPDRVRHVADAPLDLERLAQRIEAGDDDATRSRLGQAEQHQDRRRLAGAVRPEQAEHLARFDRKVETVDRERRAIALGQRLGANDRIAHRRPNRPTAPTSTSSAMTITPRPATPHSVEVSTVTR